MRRLRRSRHGRVWIFCDGSAAVPGEGMTAAGCGAAAIALDDEGRMLGMEWQHLPPLTNNEAEYAGLLLGLRIARELRAADVICVLDSEVVVGQMEGRFSVRSANLHRWHWRAQELMRELPRVRFLLIPREWNRLADGMACHAGIPWSELRAALMEGLS